MSSVGRRVSAWALVRETSLGDRLKTTILTSALS
jgi:hypothetical protein